MLAVKHVKDGVSILESPIVAAHDQHENLLVYNPKVLVNEGALELRDGSNIVTASSNYISGQSIPIDWNEFKLV